MFPMVRVATSIGIDIGNSRLHVAVRRGRAAPAIRSMPWPRAAVLADLAAGLVREAGGAAIRLAGVHRARADRLAVALEAAGGRVLLCPSDLPIPMEHGYPAGTAPGVDRRLAAFAARRLLGAPVIVVLAGTCLCVDVVDPGGVFAGGAIAPGLGASARGLPGLGDGLVPAELRAGAPYPGRTTRSCEEAGLRLLFQGGLRALLAAARAVAPGAPVVATGGDADLVPQLLGRRDVRIVPGLVLHGLLALRAPRSGRP